MQDYSTGSTVTNIFEENTNPVDASKSGMVFAGRKLPANNLIIPPLSNTPMPNLYVPFMLPAYTNGLQALAALKLMGFQYTLGNSFNDTFDAPNTISIDTVSGLTTLTWNSPVMGIQYLIGQDPIGSATQGLASGKIISVTISEEKSFLVLAPVSGSAAFTTSAEIIITAKLTDAVPDPTVSDQVCVAAYWFYQQYQFSATFTTSPNLWISVFITGVDSSISPSSTTVSLVAPTSVSVQADNSVNIVYPKTAYNLGRLPTTALGNTLVKQGADVSGIYYGYTLTSTQCIINVVGVTGGTFNATDAITIDVDESQNGFLHTGDNEISSFGIGYSISNVNQLKTTHADFNAGIVALQNSNSTKNNKFKVQGYYSYVAEYLNAIPLAEITAPDVSYYCMTAKLDVPTSLQYPNDAMAVTMCKMFNDLNNEAPYNATNGKTAVLACVASTNQVTYPTNDSLNQLTSQGITALGVNANTQSYIYRNVCTLQTLTGITDKEYRYQELQQKARWVDKNAYSVAESTSIDPVTGMRLNNSPELIANMQTNMEQLLAEGVTAKMLGNTKNSVTVALSTDDVTRLKIVISTTLISANSGSDIFVYFYPFTI